MLRQYDLSWEVQNFGVSGATLLSKGICPMYVRRRSATPSVQPGQRNHQAGDERLQAAKLAVQADFIADYENMIDTFRALPGRPQVWICKPVPAFYVNFSLRPEVIRDEILPMIEQIAREKSAPVIDLYSALQDHATLFSASGSKIRSLYRLAYRASPSYRCLMNGENAGKKARRGMNRQNCPPAVSMSVGVDGTARIVLAKPGGTGLVLTVESRLVPPDPIER